MLFRWAFRDLLRQKSMTLFLALNLSFGLAGFLAIESYKTSIATYIESNRQELLGGDVAISIRREFTDQENKMIATELRQGSKNETVVYDFFAMVSKTEAAETASRLVLVRSVDQNYPLYGKVISEKGLAMEIHPGEIWAYPELKSQLGLQVGDTVQLGQLQLKVAGFIEKDSSQSFRMASLAPRVFIRSEQLPQSGMIQFGSTFTKTHLFQFQTTPSDEEIKKKESLFLDSAIRIESANSAMGDSNPATKYLTDYLSLVSLVGFFLSSIGAIYIWRMFLQGKMKYIAVLRALGLSPQKVMLLWGIQSLLLGTLAVVPAVLIATMIFPLLESAIQAINNISLHPAISLRSVGIVWGISMGTSLLTSLPFLEGIRHIEPAKLFHEAKLQSFIQVQKLWTLIPLFVTFCLLSIWQSHSLVIGSTFFLSLVALFIVLGAMGWLILVLLSRVPFSSWSVRHGLKSASRKKATSLSVFVAIGLGSLLMSLLPQIKSSLQKEIDPHTGGSLPSLFMFDIQDEQLGGLQKTLSENNVKLSSLSSLVRARIIKVNDKAFERIVDINSSFKTREEEQEARTRNRGVNMSIRQRLSKNETIAEGQYFQPHWMANTKNLPEISIESLYAKRMGLRIGDKVAFDIQGIEIETKITSLRNVKWTSFEPNFFILIQGGVIDEAPKTWLASVTHLDDKAKFQVQGLLAKQFPNMSIIDVTRILNEAISLSDKISWSLELMASLSILTGLVVLFSISRNQMRSRRWEFNMIKILGASPKNLRNYIFAEFAILSAVAGIFGSVLGLIVAAILMRQIFQIEVLIHWGWLFTSLFISGILGAIVTKQTSQEIIHENPNQILRQGS